MFKTIFSKQIMLLVSVVLIAFIIVTSTFYLFINDVTTGEKEQELENLADSLDIFMRFYMENSASRSATHQLFLAIGRTGELSESIIILIDSEGRLIQLVSSSELNEIRLAVIDKLDNDDEVYKMADERQYQRALLLPDGGVTKDIGDFYGLYKDTGYPWLNLQKKYTIVLPDGSNFSYIISMHSPIPFLRDARSTLLDNVVTAAAISTLISIVIGFAFTKRLTMPIRKINEAAKVFANGDFSQRIQIQSKDEIGQLAETFNHMVTDLENLDTTRRDFVANVSHELRTPMTSIKGFIEGILDGTIPPESHTHYLSIVRDETERLNRLINNLLDSARYESGEYKLNMRIFDIVEVVRRCIISFVRLIEEKNIRIEASFERDKVYVEGDVDSIERVVYNLLHNAIKFTEQEGNIRIQVQEARDNVTVTVSDDGIGISEEELSSIWERFYKSDKSRGQDKIGTGLGLFIIRNIIKEHRQKISVSSKLGEGTTFSFTLAKVRQQALTDTEDVETAEL